MEGKIYRMVADNLANLANAKGDFLKMAAVDIEDLAEEKIVKIKEEALIRYYEEEKKVVEIKKMRKEWKVKKEEEE